MFDSTPIVSVAHPSKNTHAKFPTLAAHFFLSTILSLLLLSASPIPPSSPLLLLPVPKIPSPVLVIILPRFFNRTRPIPMRIRGSKTPPLNSSSAPTPSPSPPSNSPSSNGSSSRCEGLDLLVLAVIQVNGHGALDAEKIAGNGVEEEEDRIEKMEEEKGSEVEVDAKLKRRRRQLAVPSRYQDSVLQPWKRQNRRRLIGAKRSE